MENQPVDFMVNEANYDHLKQQFIYWMESQGWSKRTIDTYETNVQRFIEFLTDTADLHSITDLNPQLLYQYQHYLHRRKLKTGKIIATTTVYTNLVAVRSFLNFLFMHLHLKINADHLIKLPAKPKPIPKHILSSAQVDKLLAHPVASDPLGIRNKTILELVYASGIRNSELRNLLVQDVDLDQLQIIIRKGKYQKDRLIPMGEVAAYWLEMYLQTSRLKLFSYRSGNILFLTKSGNKITRGNLVWIVSKTANKAGLSVRVTPHSLRHTCATHMLKNGADIRYIQELLGHASVATTQIYTRVMINDLQRIFRQTHPRAILKSSF